MTPRFVKTNELATVVLTCLMLGVPAWAGVGSNEASIDPFIKMRWPGSANLAHDGTLYFVHNPDGERHRRR